MRARFSLILAVCFVYTAPVWPASFALASGFPTPSSTNAYWAREWYLQQIAAPTAWEIATTTKETIVAVIDDGVDISHPDLQSAIWTNPREIAGDGIDNDHNGFVDDVHGWNFVKNSPDVRPSETKGQAEEAWSHGTFVSSLIGARADDHVGMYGVNPRVKILPLVALDGDGYGTIPDVLNAIRYAVNQGASVINLSLSGYEDSPELQEMIQRAHDAGVLVVAATGNGDAELGRDLDRDPVYPVCMDGAQNVILGVSGTDDHDAKADFANYGRRCTDLSAPGHDMFGARPSYLRKDEAAKSSVDLYLEGMSGTSLAAPLAAGAASLLKTVRPDLTVDQVHRLLVMNTDSLESHLSAATRGKMGTGRLNVFKALQAALAIPLPTSFESTSTTSASLLTSIETTPAATSFFYTVGGTHLRWIVAPKPLWSLWTRTADGQLAAYALVQNKNMYSLKRWDPISHRETSQRAKKTWTVDSTGRVLKK